MKTLTFIMLSAMFKVWHERQLEKMYVMPVRMYLQEKEFERKIAIHIRSRVD